MCFNQPISAVLSVFGILLTFYVWFFYRKKDSQSWRFYIPVGFFTSMEILQFFQYFWLDQCDNPINQALTIVGLLHICWQPVFTNICSSYGLTPFKQKLFTKFVIPLSIVGSIFLSSRIFFYDLFPCDPINEPLCGERTCTFTGNVHIIWHIKMRAPNYFTPGGFTHAFLMFGPSLVVGNYASMLGLILTGPFLGWFISRGHSEWATIWCFYSIIQNLISVIACLPKPSNLDKFIKEREARDKKSFEEDCREFGISSKNEITKKSKEAVRSKKRTKKIN
ncbi:hypothetical protein M0812_29792 [Anaeramoeba flamelloides]|uniref:Uncharacterized protein n=1 Tax=Anaeramoeba flamelloides TaxID=1746091 RepID=A0AAV7Y690_9EUKA|nr:hypothetical protein M0812_29792 [Anaeramoeba flamelloides]